MVLKKSLLIIAILPFAVGVLSVSHFPAGGNAYVLSGDGDALRGSGISCSSLGGSWSNATVSCLLNGYLSIASGLSLHVRQGASLVIGKGATIINSGLISDDGGRISNFGTITNTLHGSIYESGGTFTNIGTINNENGGTLRENSYVSGIPGTLTNPGVINNSGVLQLYSGSTVTFIGSSGFAGSFSSTGTLNMNPGSTLKVGSLGVETTLEIVSGAFTVPSGVVLKVSVGSNVIVDSGATIVNNGQIINEYRADC